MRIVEGWGGDISAMKPLILFAAALVLSACTPEERGRVVAVGSAAVDIAKLTCEGIILHAPESRAAEKCRVAQVVGGIVRGTVELR